MSTATGGELVEDLERHLRGDAKAWDEHDIETLARRGSSTSGIGFGFRTRDARDARSAGDLRKPLQEFFGSFDDYRFRLNQVSCSTEGEIGLAWGHYTEEFKVKGRQFEVVKGRFTATLRHEADGWRMLLYHRDAQPFDTNGWYMPGSVAG